MRPVLVCDIDGTLGDWLTSCGRILVKHGAPEHQAFTHPCTGWTAYEDVCADIGLSVSSFWDAFFTEEVLISMPVHREIAATLHELWSSGWDLRYFTARRPDNRSVTIRWLMQHRFPMAGWTFVAEDRLAYCEAVLGSGGLAVLLDDRPDTLLQAHDRGIPVVAVRHPYNIDVIDELDLPYVEPQSLHALPFVLEGAYPCGL